MTAPLIKSNDLWTGTNSVEFHTIAIIGHSLPTQHYFDSLSFIGPRYRTSEKEIKSLYDVSEATDYEHWNNAFRIDPTNHELVIDSQDRISKRVDGEVGLFKFKMDFSLQQVNTYENEYAEIRKWNALNKLSDEEITLLKLEKDMVYLKLKYGNEENGEARRKKSF